MTPNELLKDITARFPVLLHDEEPALQSLLRKALVKYQELAGFSAKLRIQAEEITDCTFPLPETFFARLVLKDANGRYVSCDVWDKTLEIRLSGSEVYPLTFAYLQNVLDQDFDAYQLPVNAIGLIGDYLELLISIPNAERQRRIAIAGKLDVSDIPVEADLNARKTELEASMRLNRAIVPPLSFI